MTPSFIRLLGPIFLVLVSMTPFERSSGQGLEVDDRDIDQWSKSRLAASLDSISADLLSRPGILAPQLELAYGLARVATELDPGSASVWRRLLELSMVLENDLSGVDQVRLQAIEKLVELEPDDEVMRLRRLLDKIEAQPTAQKRADLYRVLLEPENLDKLGLDAGARIAYDLALLQQRIGNMDASALRLAQAVQLDPSFPQAADMAAGFFRSVAPTPIDEAELLAIAFTASPGDAVIARSLADLVLAAGAYASAEELYDLVSLLYPTASPIQDLLVADRMLALWGERRNDDARDLAERATRSRAFRIKQNMRMDGVDLAVIQDMVVPPAPGVAQVLAVIEARDGDRIQRDQAVATLFRSYQFDLKEIDRVADSVQENPDLTDEQRSNVLDSIEAQRAGLYADQAWARAWFGWTPSTIGRDNETDDDTRAPLSLDDLLKGALRGEAIDETQENVIRGWAAMEKEDFEQARILLSPAIDGSPYAEAGIALLDEAEGNRKEAARAYLKVYNARPGTLVGLWCRSRLESILDTRIPETEQAKLMGEMLRATLPDAVARLIRDPKHGVLSLTVEPESLRFSAFEPVILNIRLTNVSALKLAIGPDAPISPTIAIVPDVADVVGRDSDTSVDRPLIISIDRKFALEPQESIEVSVDLTSTPLANDLALASIFGGSFKMRGVVNYKVTPSGSIDAGEFGREGMSPVFRVDGIDPLEGDRLEAIIEQMRSARTVSDAKDIAAMLQLVIAPPGMAILTEDSIRLSTQDACLALPPNARAWAMSQLLPGSQGVVRLVDRLVADGTNASMALALARFSGTQTSNAIVVGMTSNDPLVKMMAKAARELAGMFDLQRDKQMLKADLSGDDEK